MCLKIIWYGLLFEITRFDGSMMIITVDIRYDTR